MAAARKLRGYESHVYFKTDGATGSATSLARLSQVDLNIKTDTIDASDHDTQGWKDKMSGLKEWTATAKYLYFTNDVSQAAIEAALLNESNLDFDFRPLDAVSEKNYTGMGVITDWKLSAGNSDAQAIDITIEGRGPLTPGTIPAAS
jgi:TP901-1 family phage major tail protein